MRRAPLTWTCGAAQDCAERAKAWLAFARTATDPRFRRSACAKAKDLWANALRWQRYVNGR